MLTSGQLLADRYRLGRRVAVGGMGEVWEAVDIRLDRTVAIKVLKPELCGDAEFLHRFRTEARTTASLNHPGIAAVHDYGETAAIPDGPEDTAYLVMELVEGEPLAAILAREGRINAEYTLDMLEQAGHALQAAHERGLVHRDVKPGNILITATGKVKLTDFGIAKAADAAPVTRSGMVMGTAHYIAPEQALGGEATPSSDIYALAVVGYECLMGHRPFLSGNAVTVAMMHIREVAPPLPPDVPPGARAAIEATLVKDPRYRYWGGGEFANAIASVRAGRPLPAPTAYAAPVPQPVNTTNPSSSGVHAVPASVPAAPGSPPAPSTGTATSTSLRQGANTLPPGVIPPQTQAPQPRKRHYAGFWVTLAVAAIVVAIVLAWVGWQVLTRGSTVLGADMINRPAQDSVRHGGPRPEWEGITPHGLDSFGQLGQTAPRRIGSAEPTRPHNQSGDGGGTNVVRSPTLDAVTTTGTARYGNFTTADFSAVEPGRVTGGNRQAMGTTTTCRNEVGGTAGSAIVRVNRCPRATAGTELRIGMMGRSLTRIGTTHQ